jgi:hypothetical protein
MQRHDNGYQDRVRMVLGMAKTTINYTCGDRCNNMIAQWRITIAIKIELGLGLGMAMISSMQS